MRCSCNDSHERYTLWESMWQFNDRLRTVGTNGAPRRKYNKHSEHTALDIGTNERMRCECTAPNRRQMCLCTHSSESCSTKCHNILIDVPISLEFRVVNGHCLHQSSKINSKRKRRQRKSWMSPMRGEVGSLNWKMCYPTCVNIYYSCSLFAIDI